MGIFRFKTRIPYLIVPAREEAGTRQSCASKQHHPQRTRSQMVPSRRFHCFHVSVVGLWVLLLSLSTRGESGHERLIAIEIDPTHRASCHAHAALPWLDNGHENSDANQVCNTSDPWTDTALWNISNGYLYHAHGEPQVYNSQEKVTLQQRWSLALQYMNDQQPALRRSNATDPEEEPQCLLNHIMCLAWATRGECEANHRTSLVASDFVIGVSRCSNYTFCYC
jgi:hypothetical protein